MSVKARGKDRERKIPLREVIAEEAAAAEREEMGQDDTFDPDRDLGSSFNGPRAFARDMRSKDQMVIDELLASLPKNQGYYLKLYREILPGKFELKERIDQYDTWTDMELEVAERVKAMTRKFGAKKWGSGLYRVVVWRNGGIRERDKYPPQDIVVDAGDNEDAAANIHQGRVDPVEAANEQLHALGNMLSAVQQVMPKAVDPNIQFQAIVQAFTAGKAEKAQAEANGNNMMMTMMSSMMSSMMALVQASMQSKSGPIESKPFEEQMAGMMNLMKSFGFGQPPQPKGVAEQLAEMKLLGFDPFKKEDTIEQIAKLKALTGSLVDIIPNGQQAERPGIFEKLVDSVAPHIPKIFADLRAMTDNAAMAQKLQALRVAQTEPQPVPMDNRPKTVYGQPIGPQQNRMSAGDAFQELPDMDPYSGFTMRPFQSSEGQDAGIREAMTGGVSGASAEQMREAYLRKSGQLPPQQPQVNGNGHVNGSQPVQQAPVQQAPVVEQPVELPIMLQQIHGLIEQNIVDAYGPLYETLCMEPATLAMIKGIQAKEFDGAMLTYELQKTGYPQFTHPAFLEKSHKYLNGFAQWVLENTMTKVMGACPACNAQHIFENLYEFVKSDRICGSPTGGTETCPGELVLQVADGTLATA